MLQFIYSVIDLNTKHRTAICKYVLHFSWNMLIFTSTKNQKQTSSGICKQVHKYFFQNKKKCNDEKITSCPILFKKLRYLFVKITFFKIGTQLLLTFYYITLKFRMLSYYRRTQLAKIRKKCNIRSRSLPQRIKSTYLVQNIFPTEQP